MASQFAIQFAFEAATDPTPILDLSSREVGGVAFVPIHTYNGLGNPLHNNLCVVLGREAGGDYSGRLNFVGGKCSDKSGSPWQVLYEEVFEELGLSLDYQLFKASLISYKWIRKSLIFFVHVTGISTASWSRMNSARKSMNLTWKYVEFSEIAHVPISSLASRPDVSQYVSAARKYVERAANSSKTPPGVHYSLMPQASGRVPGL